jgi:hypothetical protein
VTADFKAVVCLDTSNNLRSPRISVRGMYRRELAIVRAREKAEKTLSELLCPALQRFNVSTDDAAIARARARLGTATRCDGADRPLHRRKRQRSLPGYGVSRQL